MLKKTRIILSALFFGLITFYFLDFAAILPHQFHVLAHIQFVPALMSLSLFILVALIALTLIFGRIYCSVICPMGVSQDIVNRMSKKTARRKKTVPLLSCQEYTEMDCTGGDHGYFFMRVYRYIGVVRSLQCFRTYNDQRFQTCLYDRQQSIGIRLLTVRQLYILPGGRFSDQYVFMHDRPANLPADWLPCLEARTYLVQYNMSGRYLIGIREPFLPFQNTYR